MPDYPTSTYSPRTISNVPGVTYDASKTTRFYAEDLNKTNDEVVAIEETLGVNPQGSYDTVAERLDDIDVGPGGSSDWGDIGGTLSDQTDLQDALDDKVPYTGATADVDLGIKKLTALQIISAILKTLDSNTADDVNIIAGSAVSGNNPGASIDMVPGTGFGTGANGHIRWLGAFFSLYADDNEFTFQHIGKKYGFIGGATDFLDFSLISGADKTHQFQNRDGVLADDTDVSDLQDNIDAKQDALGFTAENVANKATDFSTVNDTLYPTVEAVQEAINSAVVGLLDYRGTYDASTNLFPATGGSGIAGALLKGDFYIISVAGTLGGTAVTAGDLVIALQDTPGQTSGNWDIVSNELGYAPENVANKENSTIDTSTTKYPTVNLLKTGLDTKVTANAGITGATKTKITYDAKGLVTSGTDATQDDIGDGSTYKQYSATDKTKLAGIESSADVTDEGNVGSSIFGATAKTTPVNADLMPLIDTEASNVLKKITFTNIKAFLKTYFDTLYQNALGFTAENVANKDTDGTLSANSDTKYASQKATKTYADTKLAKSGGTLTGALNEAVSVLTDGATPALDASLGNVFTLSAGGDRTIAVPSNATSGQKIVIRHLASGGARTLALNSGAGGFRFGSDITALSQTASGKYDYIGAIYNAVDSKWDVVAYVKGF